MDNNIFFFQPRIQGFVSKELSLKDMVLAYYRQVSISEEDAMMYASAYFKAFAEQFK